MTKIQEKINVESMKILKKINGEEAEYLMKLTKIKDLVSQVENFKDEFVNSNELDMLLLQNLKEEINSLL